jgi:hypothetical protein
MRWLVESTLRNGRSQHDPYRLDRNGQGFNAVDINESGDFRVGLGALYYLGAQSCRKAYRW